MLGITAAVLFSQVEQVQDLGESQNEEQGAPDQMSKQIHGAVAGIFHGDGRDVPGLDAVALATDALHYAVGLVTARIDAFALNADFSNTGKYRSAIQTVTKIPFRQNAGYMAVV